MLHVTRWRLGRHQTYRGDMSVYNETDARREQRRHLKCQEGGGVCFIRGGIVVETARQTKGMVFSSALSRQAAASADGASALGVSAAWQAGA